MTPKQLGNWGEETAAQMLEGKGMHIVGRNWRCGKLGEVDIIAENRGEIVFAEVKTRRSNRCGTPIAAIDPRKFQQVRKIAMMWLRSQSKHYLTLRIDAIGVEVTGTSYTIKHIESIKPY
jgi:putative endonuclease